MYEPIRSGAGWGRFKRGFGTVPGVLPQGHGGEAKVTLAAFQGWTCSGNVLTPLAGPVQKRSNHTGKEVEERGAIWLPVPRPLLVEMG
jgi:hypothetical protein